MYWYFYATSPKQVITIQAGTNQIIAEVANNRFKQGNGLMGRKVLAPNAGMLFPMGYSAKHSVWMFNTYIPLDIIWLDNNKQIVDIVANAPPCTESIKSACTIYTPKVDATYVLEVNAGFCEKTSITVGKKLDFDL